MHTDSKKAVSPLMVIIAFTTVYLVWGSTYFFIQKAIEHIPVYLLGAFRFIISGTLLLGWGLIKGERLWRGEQIKPAIVSGLMILFVGNGAVIWAEQFLPSSLTAVVISAAPIWFVLLDRPHWKENLRSRTTLWGLVIGFAGVILLFSERTAAAFSSSGSGLQILGLGVLVIGSISWTGGSLYSKYRSHGGSTVTMAWQMLTAGLAFSVIGMATGEWTAFQWQSVTATSWLSMLYLVVMGSLAGYSAYVWLLKVRPATEVSTYAYVNPIVAVLIGTLLAGEHMTGLQIAGLGIILTSVLLINLVKYRKKKPVPAREPAAMKKVLMSPEKAACT